MQDVGGITDVLNGLLTKVHTGELFLLLDLLTHNPRNADTSWFRDVLKPSRNVHAIAIHSLHSATRCDPGRRREGLSGFSLMV
jgi:hypothetical protein